MIRTVRTVAVLMLLSGCSRCSSAVVVVRDAGENGLDAGLAPPEAEVVDAGPRDFLTVELTRAPGALLDGEVPRGLSTRDLRRLRNAYFARKGLHFASRDLRDYFSQFVWYQAEADAVDERLSESDRSHVDEVLELERLHGELAEKGWGLTLYPRVEIDRRVTVLCIDGRAFRTEKYTDDRDPMWWGRWLSIGDGAVLVRWTRSTGAAGVPGTEIDNGGADQALYATYKDYDERLDTTEVLDVVEAVTWPGGPVPHRDLTPDRRQPFRFATSEAEENETCHASKTSSWRGVPPVKR